MTLAVSPSAAPTCASAHCAAYIRRSLHLSEGKLTEGSANMLLLAGFGILVSGYLGFATRREGKSLVQASLLASLSAAVLQAIVGCGTVWLSGTPLPYVIAPAITAWALACAAALSGALAAGLCPDREPIGCWHPWGTAA